MACSLCKQVKTIPTVSGLVYTLVPGVTTVLDNRENAHQINTPLITRPHQPRRGWNVVFNINGQEHKIIDASPLRIFAKAKALFELNSVPYTDLNLWFNLNLMWLERAIEKYQNVKYSDLIKLAQ